MPPPIQHPAEPASNTARAAAAAVEPRSLRTFTPSQAVLAESAGVYHWTPEGRRLYDFTSGVLVANLGHNPTRWTQRFFDYMGWPATSGKGDPQRNGSRDAPDGYFPAVAMTAYNA
ncbi:MAG TPA: aspartate aminotransferase family protein, partial [Urbifossiella sp.]|nr:aspartate aminotransferase family protein [Urbifossiella sp.]